MPVVKVRVKEGMRGEYGVAGSEADPKHPTGVAGHTHIIRNAGEIFTLDVRACKTAALRKAGDGGADGFMCEEITVKVDGKDKTFFLPSWVTLVKDADPRAPDPEPAGHKTTHRDESRMSVAAGVI